MKWDLVPHNRYRNPAIIFRQLPNRMNNPRLKRLLPNHHRSPVLLQCASYHLHHQHHLLIRKDDQWDTHVLPRVQRLLCVDHTLLMCFS